MNTKAVMILCIFMAVIAFSEISTSAEGKDLTLEALLHNERTEAIKAEALQDKLTPVISQLTDQIRFFEQKQEITSKILKGHNYSVAQLVFSPDGSRFASTDQTRNYVFVRMECQESYDRLPVPFKKVVAEYYGISQ